MCFSISYQRLLMKENVESVLHLWQSASLLLRGGGSVLGCACYHSSQHLFPLACSSRCHGDRKKKNMCLLHIFNTLYWSFFFFLSLLILKPGKDAIVWETTVAANNNQLCGYAFSDPLLLYLIDFHLRKMFVLISTKLPLALADYSDTYYADKRWRTYFYSNCSQSIWLAV